MAEWLMTFAVTAYDSGEHISTLTQVGPASDPSVIALNFGGAAALPPGGGAPDKLDTVGKRAIVRIQSRG